MRRLLPALLLPLAFAAWADQPPKLEPLPDAPPPPPGLPNDADLEPKVTIIKRGQDTVEEFRINGQLYMVKVTPPHGTPYYLVDQRGDGKFARLDNLDSGIRVPQWVIFEF